MDKLQFVYTSDVAPVVHGRWVPEEDYDGDTIYVCSVCDCHWVLIDGTPEENGMKFCPSCGADMREVE